MCNTTSLLAVFIAMAAAAVLLSILGFLVCPSLALIQGPWSDRSLGPDERAAALLKEMNLDEKIQMLHGPASGPCCGCKNSATCAYVGNVAPNKRLGIPPITMNDGPQGFRDDVRPGTTTAWPSGMTIGATWDLNAATEWGIGMGKEFYNKGSNIQLGPGVNVARVPRNGRNFEYISGEDPYLGYWMARNAVQGIQSQKVIANAKHWVQNNQETNRQNVIEEVDERTRFEIYYPPFRGAIDGGVGSFMCSYNKIGNHSADFAWSCENPVTLKRDLKSFMKFKGFVMSDWGATHSTSIMQGLDMEMPSAGFMNEDKIKAGMKTGDITQAGIDDAVFRILLPMFSVGVMDEPSSVWDWSHLAANTTTAASVESARRLSALSTVLLKNEKDVLPLPAKASIAVLGFGDEGAVTHGLGSGRVDPSFTATPLYGIRAAAGRGSTVVFNDGTNISEAASIAKQAEYAIVFVGTISSEGHDRASLSLDDGCTFQESSKDSQCKGNRDKQNSLVSAVAAANPKTIVVASIPGPTLMPWSKDVPAILTNFMPGQQAGNAIADVLFGKVNPSAKLTMTIPNRENEMNFTTAQWPGAPDPNNPTYAEYSEGLLVGYRYYEAKNVQFEYGFPFGHGLSYTTFNYSDLTVKQAAQQSHEVSFIVTNTGKRAGSEVAQLYLTFPASAGEPPNQLKGFRKTRTLNPGESEQVVLIVTLDDRSIWDVASHSWKPVKGQFQIKVGSSSRDLRMADSLTAQEEEIVV